MFLGLSTLDRQKFAANTHFWENTTDGNPVLAQKQRVLLVQEENLLPVQE
jgi:hypothetical protein